MGSDNKREREREEKKKTGFTDYSKEWQMEK